MTHATAFIALGANIGERDATLRSAVGHLEAHPEIHVEAGSHLYETAPVGPSNDPFLNAAARLSTTLGPVALLDALHAIERAHGRERRVRWDARTLDLDLLLFFPRGNDTPLHNDAPDCILPHPAMLERDFVLAPLADLASDLVLAGKTVAEHLRTLPEGGRTLIARLDPLLPPR